MGYFVWLNRTSCNVSQNGVFILADEVWLT